MSGVVKRLNEFRPGEFIRSLEPGPFGAARVLSVAVLPHPKNWAMLEVEDADAASASLADRPDAMYEQVFPPTQSLFPPAGETA